MAFEDVGIPMTDARNESILVMITYEGMGNMELS